MTVATLTAPRSECSPRSAPPRSSPAPAAPVPVPVPVPDLPAADPLAFDPDWYLSTYPDVAAAGLDPVRHYLARGADEHRNPNRAFDTAWYLSAHPDVAAAGLNPFLHFVVYGHRRGDVPNALTPRPTRALRSRAPAAATA